MSRNAKQFAGVSYDNLEMALNIWKATEGKPFTAAMAAQILGAKSPVYLSSKLSQLRSGNVIDILEGWRRSHYRSWKGKATEWKFTPEFQAWARKGEENH